MKPEAQTSAFDLPCEVCRDLMPLVQDGVASAASRRLVEQHTAHCAACRELWRQEDPPAMPDDRQVLPRIRRRLRLWMFGVIAVGLLLGMMLMFSSGGANYNVLLMPALGALLWFSAVSAAACCRWVWARCTGPPGCSRSFPFAFGRAAGSRFWTFW